MTSAGYGVIAMAAFSVVGLTLANIHGAPAGYGGFLIGVFFVWPWFVISDAPGLGQSIFVGPAIFIAMYVWAFSLVLAVRFLLRIVRRTKR